MVPKAPRKFFFCNSNYLIKANLATFPIKLNFYPDKLFKCYQHFNKKISLKSHHLRCVLKLSSSFPPP